VTSPTPGSARPRHQSPRKPVERHVAAELLTNPEIHMIGIVGAALERVDRQEVRPDQTLVFGILGPVENGIDQSLAFARVAVIEKAHRLVGRGQRAQSIQINPPHEDRVGRQTRRLHIHAA